MGRTRKIAVEGAPHGVGAEAPPRRLSLRPKRKATASISSRHIDTKVVRGGSRRSMARTHTWGSKMDQLYEVSDGQVLFPGPAGTVSATAQFSIISSQTHDMNALIESLFLRETESGVAGKWSLPSPQ